MSGTKWYKEKSHFIQPAFGIVTKSIKQILL